MKLRNKTKNKNGWNQENQWKTLKRHFESLSIKKHNHLKRWLPVKRKFFGRSPDVVHTWLYVKEIPDLQVLSQS